MLFTSYGASAPSCTTRSRRLSIGLLVGLVFSVSACASNSTFYRSYGVRGGHHSGAFIHGYYGPAYQPYAYHPPHYARQPDWSIYGQDLSPYRWHRYKPYHPGLERQRRVERERYFQLQQHRERMIERRRDRSYESRILPDAVWRTR